ncbi:MAG: hypothetical protein KatS3mg115_2192 [Candidatus Poribacteria bacterium]|nr:MAG: hypothetical protein KatS3mg115_2192 [Candidatus Poribacteria bacterium]
MRWFRWLSGALLGFVLLGPPGWAGAPPLFLTRDPEALRLVDRLVARGLLPIEYSVTRMFDRDRLADRLEELGESAELSQAERDRIAALVPYLRLEEETFRIETEPPMAGAITATGELLLQTRWMQGEKRGLAGMGIARLTNRNPFFGVHAEFGWGTLTDLDFAPTPLDVAQTFQTFEFLPEEALNRSLGYLSLGGESASLLIGKFDLAWGSGRNGTLFLSENTDAKSGLLFSARSGPLHMEALTVSLPHEGTDTYLSAHRLDVRPHRRMLLSAYEGMVYKDRIELNYVNPFAVYLLLYPQLDRTRREAGPGGVGDNAIIGGAFTLIPIDGMIVFADLCWWTTSNPARLKAGTPSLLSSGASTGSIRWACGTGTCGRNTSL